MNGFLKNLLLQLLKVQKEMKFINFLLLLSFNNGVKCLIIKNSRLNITKVWVLHQIRKLKNTLVI